MVFIWIGLIIAMQESGGQTGPPAPPAPSLLVGPVRVELQSVQESRSATLLDPKSSESTLTFQFRVVGEKLPAVARFGPPVITEIVDDTGASLLDPKIDGPRNDAVTRRLSMSPQQLERIGISLTATALGPKREARHIKSLRGTVRLVNASKKESVYFDHPRGLQGQPLAHPRLRELGVEVRVLDAGDPARTANSKRHVGLRFLKGGERLHDVAFCDPWLRPLRSKGWDMKTNAGEDCLVYVTDSDLGDEHVMVLELYTDIEDVRLPIELHDLPLP
ncbi:MAG: hypothetical protein CHACPFDD_01391 [Phycisphaerae bacterium]|nr:hypothetical protein [Phycisphaerae bacterium]